MAVLFGCSLLLMLRGCTGVVALYQSTEYVWVNDSYFYPLDTLPELIAVGILAWPTLLARWDVENLRNHAVLCSSSSLVLPGILSFLRGLSALAGRHVLGQGTQSLKTRSKRPKRRRQMKKSPASAPHKETVWCVESTAATQTDILHRSSKGHSDDAKC